MTAVLCFENKATGKCYRIIKHDPEKKVFVLKGKWSSFQIPADKERIEEMGYRMVKKDLEPEE